MSNLVLMECFTEWCGPCKSIEADVAQMILDYPRVEIKRIDLDKEIGADETYDIRSIPTFLFMRDGKEVERIVGTDISMIRARLDHHLGEEA